MTNFADRISGMDVEDQIDAVYDHFTDAMLARDEPTRLAALKSLDPTTLDPAVSLAVLTSSWGLRARAEYRRFYDRTRAALACEMTMSESCETLRGLEPLRVGVVDDSAGKVMTMFAMLGISP